MWLRLFKQWSGSPAITPDTKDYIWPAIRVKCQMLWLFDRCYSPKPWRYCMSYCLGAESHIKCMNQRRKGQNCSDFLNVFAHKWFGLSALHQCETPIAQNSHRPKPVIVHAVLWASLHESERRRSRLMLVLRYIALCHCVQFTPVCVAHSPLAVNRPVVWGNLTEGGQGVGEGIGGAWDPFHLTLSSPNPHVLPHRGAW